MTQISPFKGLVYNQKEIKDISKVTCPPYDVISPEQQEFFMNLDKHNLIHILLRKDVSGEDKYIKAGQYFKQWIEEGVFVRDEKPAVYFYIQEYNLRGEKKKRSGLIALLKLPEDDGGVYKHEHTRSEPKEDRLKLLRQVKANLSPIFAILPDRKRVISYVYQKCASGNKPFIDITDQEKVNHKLWRIDSEDMLLSIQQKLADEDIFIADGHHRFEVSCIYRDEMKKNLAKWTGEESFNYILTYLTGTDSRELTIMAINRLVKLGAGFDMSKFISALSEYFDIEQVKDKTKFFLYMHRAGSHGHIIGMYKEKKFWLLRLKNIKLLDKLIADKNKEYRSLDVSVLNYIILKKIMGMDIEDKKNIEYSHDQEELIEMADNVHQAVAFFLNPVKIQQIMAVALSGERMPSKSTYFYPKVLSGLVINKFE